MSNTHPFCKHCHICNPPRTRPLQRQKSFFPESVQNWIRGMKSPYGLHDITQVIKQYIVDSAVIIMTYTMYT